MTANTIEPKSVKALMSAGEEFILLDVREDKERAYRCIEPSRHIPLGDLPKRVGELDRNARVVAYCHAGVRSLKAANWLLEQGFAKVESMSGGIERWAVEVDPAMPR